MTCSSKEDDNTEVGVDGSSDRCKVFKIHNSTIENTQCVLRWINSEKDLSVFVRNRVKEINKDSDIVFGFVSTTENPADVATRGTTASNL